MPRPRASNPRAGRSVPSSRGLLLRSGMLGEDERVAGRPGDIDGAADRESVSGLWRKDGDRAAARRADEVLAFAPEIGNLLDGGLDRPRLVQAAMAVPSVDRDRLGSHAQL